MFKEIWGNIYISFFYFLIMAEEIKRFVTSDGEYDRTKLIDTIFKNAENYGTYRKSRQQNFDVGAFNAALSDVTEAIENGTLTRGAGRKYNYTGDNQLNTAAHAAALDLIDRTLSAMSRIPKEEAKKYQSNIFDRFNKRFYGGNFKGTEDDLLPWKQGVYTYDELASIFDDEAEDLQSAKDKGLTYDFEGSPYYDYDDGISKNRKLAENLRDGTIDASDLADWMATGGDATTFRQLTGLTAPRENAIEKEWKTQEQILRDLELSDEEIQKRRAQFYESKRFDALKPFYSQDYNEKWNAFAKQHFTGQGENDLVDLGVDEIDLTDWNGEKTNEANDKPSWLEREGNADYADRLYKHALSGTYYEGAKDGYTNSQILRLYMAEQLAKDPDQFLKIDDNNVLISSTIDLNTGTAVKFNTDTNKFTRIHVDPQSTPILLAELKKKYQELNPYLVHSGDYVWGSFAKNGGKLNQLKALKQGGNIQYALSGAELAKLKKEEREGKYEQSVIDRALQKGVSEDAIRLGDKAASTDDSTNALIRNISTGLDVAGGVASFIPVIGNAAGAILGTVGTVGNLVADAMDDSVSSEEMWTNLGINAGLTGLMLIPGGGTASLAGKAIKGAKTVAQVGMTGYAGYNVAKNWDRIKELNEKRKNGTLSHEEQREFNMYLSMASGTVTGTKGIAAHAAPKLGKNWAGKTAAAIADPIVGLGKLAGHKKSSRVFNDMLKSTKPVRTTAEGRAKGELFEYTDANGKTWEITATQKKAMLQAESDGRAAGLTGKELDQKIGEAWANAHPEKATKNITYSTPEENFTKTWETADDAIKAALGATKDPITGDITIGNITFSNKSATTLKDVYNDAISKVPDTDPRLAGKSGADLDMAKHQIGIEAARAKFVDLPEAKGIKAGTINGPIFNMGNTSALGKWFNKVGLHRSSLDLDDTGSSAFSRWANSGEGYRFDQNTATGRGNLRMRMRQRQHAQDYFSGLGKFGDALLDKFNTNWEMGQGMSAFRNRTDELLDLNAERRAYQSSEAGKAQIAKQERRVNRFERRKEYAAQLKKFEESPEGKVLLLDLEQKLGRTPTELEKFKLLLKHEDRWITRASDYITFKNSREGHKVLADLEKAKGRPLTVSEQVKEMRKYQKDVATRSRELLNKYQVDYSKDLDAVRSNKAFARMSDDAIMDVFIIAQDNGYTGTLRDYPKYLAQQQADIKAATGKKPTARQIWQQEKLNSAHTKYQDLFTDTRKAVALAQRKYGLTGSDEQILQTLKKDANLRDQIANDLQNINIAREFKKTLVKGDSYDPENVALIQNFKREHPGAAKALSSDEIVLRALGRKKQNVETIESYISKHPDLSESQITELRSRANSGKKLTEAELKRVANRIKSIEDNLSQREALRSQVESIFDPNTPEGRNFIREFDTQYKKLSPTLTPDQRKAEAFRIRKDIYDKHIAKQDAEAARTESQNKNYERLLDSREKARQREEARLLKDKERAEILAEIDKLADEYGLSSSQKIMLRMRGLPLSNKELLKQAKALAKKEGINIEQAKELILQKRANEYQKSIDNYKATRKSKTQLNEEAKQTQEEEFLRGIEEYKQRSVDNTWRTFEKQGALTTKDSKVTSAFTSALQELINNNKHLKEAGVSLATIRHYFTSQASAGKSFIDIVSDLKNPSILKALVPISRLGSKLITLKTLRRNFTTDNSQTSDELSYLKQGGILKASKGVQIPEWYSKRYKYQILNGWSPSLNSDYQGSLGNTDWHKKAGDLNHAYTFNDAYINSGYVGKDIQNYYNIANISDIDQFITDYNNKIKLIDDRFNNDLTYGSTGARQGNQAYKKLFNSTVSDPNLLHHLGYNDQQDDIWGSTSWLRRADKYEKELSDLTEDELKSRTHVIKDKEGKEYVIYKNADGTITRVNPISNTDSSSGRVLQGDGGGTDDPQKQPINWEQVEKTLNGIIPDGLSALRLFKNLRNNKRISELAKLKKAVYRNPIQGHENIYGDFQALQTAQHQGSTLLSQAFNAAKMTNNAELAAAMLLDAQLKANETLRHGKQVDNAALKESAYKSETAEAERYAKNQEIGYENSVRSNAKRSADIDATIGEHSANTTNWNTWLSEQEQRFRQKNLDNEELYRKIALSDFEKWWSDNVTDTPEIKAKLQQLQETTDDATYNKLLNEIYKMRTDNADRYSRTRFEKLRDIMKGDYWSKLNTDYYGQFQIQLKKGGKVNDAKIKRRAEDLRELRKQIRHSITTNQKALDNLSRATLLELKKMMDL